MNFNRDVIECRRSSPTGAQGISQWMPKTAVTWHVSPCDVASAIDGQARYMSASLKKFKSKDMALASYNAGIAKVAALGRVPRFNETLTYVAHIKQFEKEMELGK